MEKFLTSFCSYADKYFSLFAKKKNAKLTGDFIKGKYCYENENIKIIKQKLQKQNIAVNKSVHKLLYCFIQQQTLTSNRKCTQVNNNPQATLQK